MTAVISGSAGVIGATVGVLGNMINALIQRRSNEAARLDRTNEAKFLAYNEVLDMNGRQPILEPGKGCGWRPDLYVKDVRPVLFKNFHLLGDRVRSQVRLLDNRLQLKRWGLTTEEDVSDALEYMYYFKLIELIEREYRSLP